MATYVILIIASLLCDVALNVPVGSLPLSLVKEGASESQAAIAMGSGMCSALFVSIPLGMLVDRVGRLTVMKWSAIASLLVMIFLGLTHGFVAGCAGMALRTIALVAFMTAQFAYATNIFSKERMVSAVASLGIIGNIAFASGPAIGVWLWQHGIHHEQYYYAAIPILISALLVMALPEKLDVQQKKPPKRRVVIRRAWMPAMTFILAATLQGGVNFSLAVLTFQSRGIVNGALIFTVAALTTVVFRYWAGRLVETLGARLMAIPTAIFQIAGCLIAAQASDIQTVSLAGICFGIGWAAVPPIGIALLFERSSERTRGTAMGSYNFAMSSGAALGSLIATVATAIGYGYCEAITLTAVAPCLALIYLYTAPRKTAKALPA